MYKHFKQQQCNIFYPSVQNRNAVKRQLLRSVSILNLLPRLHGAKLIYIDRDLDINILVRHMVCNSVGFLC